MSKKVLVTGGSGYKGGILLPKLLKAGYEVVNLDLDLYGTDGLPKGNPKFNHVHGDIRDIELFKKLVKGCDLVIHMACISNDPSFELNPDLSRTINYEAFEPMVIAAKEAGVKRFLYLSSSSVYGVSDAPEVTEEHPLVPLTDYNKYKGMCEPLLFKHQSKDFVCIVARPATVCGYSPRLRLDLSVNILTHHAVKKGKITVFGGTQQRPNIHIEDVTDCYMVMIEAPAEKVAGQIFNVGYENQTIADLAQAVKKVVEQEYPERGELSIETTPSNDNRSYRITSRKITEVLGFKPKHTIEDAVRGLVKAFKRGEFADSMTNDQYSNVKSVQKSGLK